MTQRNTTPIKTFAKMTLFTYLLPSQKKYVKYTGKYWKKMDRFLAYILHTFLKITFMAK